MVKKEAGQGLNGAQTQSLINIIMQYQQGIITRGQAISIISLSVGISKEEAADIVDQA